MSSKAAERTKRYRQRMRARGFRLVQLWVQDARRPGFLEECRRQSARCAQSDAEDPDLDAWMDRAAADIEDWR